MAAWRWPGDHAVEAGKAAFASYDPLECLGLYGEKNEYAGPAEQDAHARESKRSLKASALARLQRNPPSRERPLHPTRSTYYIQLHLVRYPTGVFFNVCDAPM